MKRFLVTSLTSLALFGTLFAQTAQDNNSIDHKRCWHHQGGFWHELKELNLSDAQKQQVRGILQSNRQTARSIAKDLLTARRDVQAAVVANPNDQATIRTKASALNNAITELIVNRAAVYAQILPILNSEQQQKLNQLLQERAAKMQQRIDKLSQPSDS